MRRSSDVNVFNDVFVRGGLDFWRSLENFSPEVILDLGANVGFASAMFLSLFPRAFVLAVEPDPSNAERCRKNLAPYGNRAKVVEGAVWHSRGHLMLSRGTFRDGREWATQVRPAHPDEIPDIAAWDIPTLLEMCPRKQVDILKIDIEGSESALFSVNVDEWLSRVHNICIEVHDAECQKAIAAALASYRHQSGRTGEYALYLGISRIALN
jgi:FkbM family methyltransferase